jgi:hypothetical protein
VHRIIRLTALSLAAAGVLTGPVAQASAASSPSVTAANPTRVAQTSAQFNGTVNPNGAATTYTFQYGLTSAYGLSTSLKNAGRGTKFVKASATATGLIPGTVYHFRIVALNSHGGAVGRDHTFTTVGPPPPGASTGPASAVGVNGATLSGVITPNNAVTGYEFQYGTTVAYGSQSPSPAASVPAGTTPVTVTATLTGLAQNQLFHFRLVAFHTVGPASYGADQVFMTEPSPRDKPAVHASTSPRRAKHNPFVFTTSGRIAGPSSISPAFDCNGFVGVRTYLGRRNVSFVLLPVTPECTFAGTTTFHRKPGHGARKRQVHLKVVVYFRGNGYLKPAFAKSQQITIG